MKASVRRHWRTVPIDLDDNLELPQDEQFSAQLRPVPNWLMLEFGAVDDEKTGTKLPREVSREIFTESMRNVRNYTYEVEDPETGEFTTHEAKTGLDFFEHADLLHVGKISEMIFAISLKNEDELGNSE